MLPAHLVPLRRDLLAHISWRGADIDPTVGTPTASPLAVPNLPRSVITAHLQAMLPAVLQAAGGPSPLPPYTPGVYTVPQVKARLSELDNNIESYRYCVTRVGAPRTPNRTSPFPWTDMIQYVLFLIAQPGSLKVSNALFTAAMVFFKLLSDHPRQRMAELCYMFAMLAYPDNYRALAQWAHVVRNNGPKDDAARNEKVKEMFLLAKGIQLNLPRDQGHTSIYPHTVRGLCDMNFREAVSLLYPPRELLLDIYNTLSHLPSEKDYIHGLRCFACTCILLGDDNYIEEAKQALAKLAGLRGAGEREYAQNAQAMLRNLQGGATVATIRRSRSWGFLSS